MHFVSSCLLVCAFYTLGSDCENVSTVTGQNVSLNCSVDVDVGADTKIDWKVPDEQQHRNVVRGHLVNDSGNRTAIVLLSVQNVTAADADKYILCEVTTNSSRADGKNYTLTIIFGGQNVSLNCSVNVDVGSDIKFTWKVSDEQQLQNVVGDRLVDDWEKRTAIVFLEISNVTAADAGEYMCKMRNSVHRKIYTIIISDKTKSNVYNEHLILFICFAMLTLAIIVAPYLNGKRKMIRNSSNRNSAIEGQPDLLPDVEIFDFHKLQLKIGKELGLGKFGVVCKAEAIGMIKDVTTTTVCVKMAKSNTEQTHIDALRSELDIMIHVGMHLNIVNLLGAYTGSINKKLMMITEYCRFGNIHYYLSSQRNSFINQIKSNGEIDFNIHTKSSNSTNGAQNANVPGKHDESIGSTQIVNNDEYLIPGESKRHINYCGDYNDIKPSCTYDLVFWSLQIARGMEYIASKKIFQFNLTTRNILLAEGNIVKICDFGSSEIIKDDRNYTLMSSTDVPIQWLAIECLRDRVYRTQSTIWTYGVVLWEIFSLCAIPYPNMGAQEVLNELVKGYRLKQPPFANQPIFEMMLSCWQLDPLQRPSFHELASTLEDILRGGTILYLNNLNENYVNMNNEKLPTTNYSILVPVTSFQR